jgi:hypothetical protein
MSVFGSVFGGSKPSQPVELRDTLFGDMPIDQWVGNGAVSQGFPWSAFVLARARMKRGERQAAINNWLEVVNQPGAEPRHHIQAWHFLRQNGCLPPATIARQLLGVVVEVGMPKGLDIVAAYADGSARYYNFSGRGIVWDRPNNSLDFELAALLSAGAKVVEQIGPWEKSRPPAPPADQVRLNFLTPSGLHFGQAHMDVMAKDPIGSGVFNQAARLMQALIEKSAATSAA